MHLCEKFWKRWEYQTTSLAIWEICTQVRKQQLELYMEQQTCSKSGKEYIKAVYCHPAYLTYMQLPHEKCWAGWSTSWASKNWCFWTVVLENTLESPLDCKEIKPVNPKGNQSWIFIGSSDAEGETLATWCEELTHWKRLMLGKIEGGRRREQQRTRFLDGITNSMDMSLSRL